MLENKDIRSLPDDDAVLRHERDNNDNIVQTSMSEVVMRINLLGRLIIPPSVNS